MTHTHVLDLPVKYLHVQIKFQILKYTCNYIFASVNVPLLLFQTTSYIHTFNNNLLAFQN